jgi:hypothetical protein
MSLGGRGYLPLMHLQETLDLTLAFAGMTRLHNKIERVKPTS